MLAKPVLMKYPCESAESPRSAMAMANRPDAGPQHFGRDDAVFSSGSAVGTASSNPVPQGVTSSSAAAGC